MIGGRVTLAQMAKKLSNASMWAMNMTKTDRPHLTYLSTLELITKESRHALKALVSHHGELGRITEEIIKGVLERLLPKRFSIGTGFIINSKGDVSAQTDIVIYDEFYNRPLLSEYGVRVFPVECVYATIEVKSILDSDTLQKSVADIMRLRKIGSAKEYVVDQKRVIIKTTPRSYIVGFKQRGLGKNYTQFRTKLAELLNEKDAHVHGVCILENDWFAFRKAYAWPAVLLGREGNSLTQLYRAILVGQYNYAVYPMDIRPYLGEDE
jgi:hypothetical protein